MSASLAVALGALIVSTVGPDLSILLMPLLVMGSVGRVLLGFTCSSLGKLCSSRLLELGGGIYALGAVLSIPTIVLGVPLIIVADVLLYRGSGVGWS